MEQGGFRRLRTVIRPERLLLIGLGFKPLLVDDQDLGIRLGSVRDAEVPGSNPGSPTTKDLFRALNSWASRPPATPRLSTGVVRLGFGTVTRFLSNLSGTQSRDSQYGANEVNMHQSKVRVGILLSVGAATIGLAVPAGASTDHVAQAKSTTSTTVNSKGSHPNSHFCQLLKQEQTQDSSKLETAATKALEKQNWKVAQADLKKLYGQSTKLVKEITAALSSAPAKVRAAAKQGLKLLPAEEKAVSASTSVDQFETAEEASTSTQAFKSVAQTLSTYETAQCGNQSPTT